MCFCSCLFFYIWQKTKNQCETYYFLIFLKLDWFWGGGKNISKLYISTTWKVQLSK